MDSQSLDENREYQRQALSEILSTMSAAETKIKTSAFVRDLGNYIYNKSSILPINYGAELLKNETTHLEFIKEAEDIVNENSNQAFHLLQLAVSVIKNKCSF